MATGKGVDAWSMADAYRWFMASQASDKKPEYITLAVTAAAGTTVSVTYQEASL